VAGILRKLFTGAAAVIGGSLLVATATWAFVVLLPLLSVIFLFGSVIAIVALLSAVIYQAIEERDA